MGLVPSAERIDSFFSLTRRVEGEEIETLWMERRDNSLCPKPHTSGVEKGYKDTLVHCLHTR